MFAFLFQVLRAIVNFIRRLFGSVPNPPSPSNNPPTAQIVSPHGDVIGDKIVIEYKLFDVESDAGDVTVMFSVAGGPFNPATPDTQDPRHGGISGLATNPLGVNHFFIWNWRIDILQNPVDDVILSIQPKDAFGQGAVVTSVPFRISAAVVPISFVPQVTVQKPDNHVVADEVDIQFLVSDANSDNADIIVEYSLSGGTPIPATPKMSDPRHSGTSGLPTNPTGLVYHFIWDWQADLGSSPVNDVTVFVQARDSSGSGLQASSVAFNLATPSTQPTLQIDILNPSGGAVMVPPVLIEYSLKDALSNISDVVIEYSLDNGSTFFAATPHPNSQGISSLPSGPQGISHTFLWDTLADLTNPNVQDVIILIKATYGQTTVTQQSNPFHINVNYPPAVDVWLPSGGLTTSPVRVEFVLTDRDSTALDITAEFRVPGGNFVTATPHPNNPGVQGLITDPFGINHHFLWDAHHDLAGQSVSDITFRVKASDGTAEGSDFSAAFDVGSPLPNAIIDFPKGGNHGAPVALLFQVSDPTHNIVQGQVEYSTDQGQNFRTANPAAGRGSEDLSNLSAAPSPVNHFFVWDAAADLSSVPLPHSGIILKARITSPYGTVEVNSLPFDIRYSIPGAPPLPPITPNSSTPEIHDLFKGGTNHQSQIPLRFTLSDADMKPTSVLVEYDDGSGFKTATPSPQSDTLIGLAAPDILFDHRFVWDAQADMGIMTSQQNVPIRMTPYVGSKKGVPKIESIPVKVKARPALPTPETVQPMTNLVMSIEDGDGQIGAGGFLMPETLKVKVEGPNDQGQMAPLPGVRVSFKILAPQNLPIKLEDDLVLGSTTQYNGLAGIRVRTPEVIGNRSFQIKATVVGVPIISQTFSLNIGKAEIASATNNSTDVNIGSASIFSFFIDADGDVNTTNHLQPEKDDPLIYRIQATHAVIDNTFPKVPELQQTLFGSPGHLFGKFTLVPTTPGSDVRLTVDVPSRPGITPKIITIPVNHPANARRRIRNPRTTTTSTTPDYEDLNLKFELIQNHGYHANNVPQRGYAGLKLEKSFKVQIKDQHGVLYTSRSQNSTHTSCQPVPTPLELEIEWTGSNLEFSTTTGRQEVGSIRLSIQEEVFVKPIGPGPWQVRARCNPGRRRFLDPHPNFWSGGSTAAGTYWCHKEHALRGVNSSRVVVNGVFLVERANLDLYDISTGNEVHDLHPGMRVEIRMNNFSPYTGTPDPEPVQFQLEQPNGRQPVAQQGVSGEWSETYDLHRHSNSEFRSRAIWIAQGASHIPAGINDKIHGIIPAASLVGGSSGLSFSKPTQGRRRHRRLIEETEMLQEAPVGTSPSAGVNNTVDLQSGEYIENSCDLQFASRIGTLSVCRTYRSQVVSENPEYEPLGPGWFLDTDSFITLGSFNQLWRSGRSDDLYLNHHLGSLHPKGLFFDIQWKSVIDLQNSAIEMHDINGSKTHFNTDGSVRFLEDRHGYRFNFVYDEKGRLIRITDSMEPLSRWIEFEYLTSSTAQLHGRLIKVKDFTGREVQYDYYRSNTPVGGIGWLKKVTYPLCPTMRGGQGPDPYQRSESYEYEPDPVLGWRLKNVLNSDNEIKLINHYDKGRIVRQEPKRDDADRRDIKFDYSVNSQTLVIDPKGNQTKYIFPSSPFWDAACTKQLVEDAGGQSIVTSMQHNHHGLMVELQNPMGEKTKYIYDKDNFSQRSRSNLLAEINSPRPASVTRPVRDRVITFTYENDYNQVKSRVAPDGNHPDSDPNMYKSKYTYDSYGNLTEEKKPRSLNAYRKTNGGTRWLEETTTVSYEYNSFQQIKKKIDEMGIVTSYLYYPVNDPAGLGGSTPIEDGGGFLGMVSVDTEQTTKRQDRLGDTTPLEERKTQYFYNALGDMVSIIENKGTAQEKKTDFDVNVLHEVNKITRAAASSHAIVSNYYYNADFLLAQKEFEQPGAGNVAGGDKLIKKMHYNRQGVMSKHETRIWDTSNNQFKWLISNVALHDDDKVHFVEPPYNQAFPDLKEIMEYDNRGLPKTMSQGTQVTTFKPTNNGDIQEMTMPSGDTTNIEYDLFGEENASIDGRGNIYKNETDVSGRVVRSLAQHGHESNPNRSYPMPGLPYAHMTEQKYNENGFPRRRHHVQSYLPTPAFPAPAAGTPIGPVSDYLAPDLSPLPPMMSLQQDGKSLQGDGRSITDTLTNALGMVTRIANDEVGYEMYGYSPHQELTETQSFTGNNSSMKYDTAGNLTDFEEKTVSRDSSGAIVRQSFFQKYDYDEHDRVKRVIDNEGNAMRMEYDQTDFVVKTWDTMGNDSNERFQNNLVNEPGNLTTISRDALGRVVKIETTLTANGLGGGPPEITPYNQLGKVIHEMEYYENGGPFKAFIDHARYHRDIEYQSDGLVNKIRHWLTPGIRTGASHSNDMVFVPNSHLMDHSIDPNGSKIQFQYHNTHKEFIRSIESILPAILGPNVKLDGATKYEFKYDGDGNIEQIKDTVSGYEINSQWDNQGRLVQENQGNYTFKNTYVGDGETQLLYPGSTGSVDFKYDRMGRLIHIDDQGQNLANFYYKGDDRLRKRSYGNIDIEYHHDDAGILKNMSIQFSSTAIQFDLELDRMNRIKKMIRISGSVTEETVWNYDSVGRIIKESFTPPGSTSALITNRYYDGDDVLRKQEQDVLQGTAIVQNVTEQNRAYMGQISTRNGTTFAYDNNGNLTDDGNQQYVYDPLNRLVRIENNGQTICSYIYDGQNRLIRRTAGSDIEEYVYDGWQLVEVRQGISGPVKERFVYSDETDDLIAVKVNGQVYRVIYDPIGNVDSIIDGNNQLVESYQYNLNGEVTVLDPNRQITTATPIIRVLFMGRVYDSVSKLYQYRMRWYHPKFNIYITPDPLGFSAGPNYYLLCDGDPVNLTDPTGLDPNDIRRILKAEYERRKKKVELVASLKLMSVAEFIKKHPKQYLAIMNQTPRSNMPSIRAWRKGDRMVPRPRVVVRDGWSSFAREVLLPAIFMLPTGGTGAVARIPAVARTGGTITRIPAVARTGGTALTRIPAAAQTRVGSVIRIPSVAPSGGGAFRVVKVAQQSGSLQPRMIVMRKVAQTAKKNTRVYGPHPRPARITKDGVGQSGKHVLKVEHRDKIGRLKSRGQELSGCDVAPGGTLSGRAQKSVHTEPKWLWKNAPEIEAGGHIVMQGRLPPCGHVTNTELGCFRALEDFAKEKKVWIDYFDEAGRSWSFGPEGYINPLTGF